MREQCTLLMLQSPVFLIRSYGAPNDTGRCSVPQCHDNTWATLAQSKIKLGQYCQLVVALLDVGS